MKKHQNKTQEVIVWIWEKAKREEQYLRCKIIRISSNNNHKGENLI